MDLTTFTLLLLAALLISANIFALYWFGSMLIPIFSGGGVYVPTPPDILGRMLHLACIGPEDVVVDMGSGDGRIVIASARAGAKRSIGYEIHPGLARLSNRNIKQAGLEDRACVFNQSMWGADVSKTSVIFLYQIPYAMERMKKLLESKLTPGSRVVSHAFQIPGWKPDTTEGNVFLYKIKSR